jgi:hypothetical protein
MAAVPMTVMGLIAPSCTGRIPVASPVGIIVGNIERLLQNGDCET